MSIFNLFSAGVYSYDTGTTGNQLFGQLAVATHQIKKSLFYLRRQYVYGADPKVRDKASVTLVVFWVPRL